VLAARTYDRLIEGLAILAAASLFLMTFLIAADVILRNTGFHPIQPASALIEYALMFSTMAGAPWLVRRHGHIAITSFVGRLPERARRVVGQAVLFLSVAILALLSWRAGAVGLDQYARQTVDIRSIGIPGWVLYAMLCGGFALMATEFLRLAARGEVYSGGEGGH
jgi:TRAP-type C4-dicarboxylate transport system permease small subunit